MSFFGNDFFLPVGFGGFIITNNKSLAKTEI